MNNKHSNSDFAPFVTVSQEKCQRSQLVYPFTCMVAGMTGKGKTICVQKLLQQAQNVIDQPLERTIWYYSQWQTQLFMMIPTIEFVKDIASTLENNSYLDIKIRNSIQMIDRIIET